MRSDDGPSQPLKSSRPGSSRFSESVFSCTLSQLQPTIFPANTRTLLHGTHSFSSELLFPMSRFHLVLPDARIARLQAMTFTRIEITKMLSCLRRCRTQHRSTAKVRTEDLCFLLQLLRLLRPYFLQQTDSVQIFQPLAGFLHFLLQILINPLFLQRLQMLLSDLLFLLARTLDKTCAQIMFHAELMVVEAKECHSLSLLLRIVSNEYR